MSLCNVRSINSTIHIPVSNHGGSEFAREKENTVDSRQYDTYPGRMGRERGIKQEDEPQINPINNK